MVSFRGSPSPSRGTAGATSRRSSCLISSEGELIDTKFGTLPVESAEKTPDAEKHDGKIVCRLP
jgi:hypothetical protein